MFAVRANHKRRIELNLRNNIWVVDDVTGLYVTKKHRGVWKTMVEANRMVTEEDEIVVAVVKQSIKKRKGG